MKSKIVKVVVELTKDQADAMENFMASNITHRDQNLSEFAAELVRRAWGELWYDAHHEILPLQ